MYARVRTVLSQGELLAVPESAVIFSGRRRIVIVDEGGGTFRPVLVRLGRMWAWEEGHEPSEERALPFHRGMQRYHEVLAGLREGDVVVTSGSFLINSESQLQGALARMIEEEEARPDEPAATGPFHDAMRDAASEYLKIQDALSKDTLEHVGHIAQALVRKAKAASSTAGDEEERALADSLAAAGESLAGLTEPDAVREAFAGLSDAIIEYWRNYGPGSGIDAHVAYCPMVDERWLQEGKSIRNPYDPSMLRCGRIVE
jgi:hypothetical protein